jgi:hypothetical protein
VVHFAAVDYPDGFDLFTLEQPEDHIQFPHTDRICQTVGFIEFPE